MTASEISFPDLSLALGRLQGLLHANPGRSLVALAGLPGSGKSTLAEEICRTANQRLGVGTMVSLGMDGFHYPKAHLATFPDPAAALRRRGAPWTFDAQGLAGRLAQLRADYLGTPVPWPQFRHGVGDPEAGGPEVPATTRLILVEGLYLLMDTQGWEGVSEQFNEGWFLGTPLEVALERVTKRHMASWGLERSEAEARVQRNDALNAQIVLGTRHKAQLLLL